MSTPLLDVPLRRASDFANFSKPWFLVAAALALFGGPRGRRAAVTGAAAIGVTSFVVNQPMKLAGERHRPDRTRLGVPESRWVPMPSSTSFPSGHSGSAAAFAVSVGDVLPKLRLPLRAAAAVVIFSRVYTGVHYPVTSSWVRRSVPCSDGRPRRSRGNSAPARTDPAGRNQNAFRDGLTNRRSAGSGCSAGS